MTEKLFLLKLNWLPFEINVKQVFLPIPDKLDDELEYFYGDIENITKHLKRKNLIFVWEIGMQSSG